MKRCGLAAVSILLVLMMTSSALAQQKGRGKAAGGKGEDTAAERSQNETSAGRDRTAAERQAGAEAERRAPERTVRRQSDAAKEQVEAEEKKAEKAVEEAKEDIGEQGRRAKGREIAETARQQGRDMGQQTAQQAREGVKGQGQAKGRGQQAAAIQRQIVHEDQKHLQRQARLQRMLEVAQEKGDDRAAGRIETLMEREGRRYQTKSRRLAERAAAPEASEQAAGEND